MSQTEYYREPPERERRINRNTLYSHPENQKDSKLNPIQNVDVGIITQEGRHLNIWSYAGRLDITIPKHTFSNVEILQSLRAAYPSFEHKRDIPPYFSEMHADKPVQGVRQPCSFYEGVEGMRAMWMIQSIYSDLDGVFPVITPQGEFLRYSINRNATHIKSAMERSMRMVLGFDDNGDVISSPEINWYLDYVGVNEDLAEYIAVYCGVSGLVAHLLQHDRIQTLSVKPICAYIEEDYSGPKVTSLVNLKNIRRVELEDTDISHSEVQDDTYLDFSDVEVYALEDNQFSIVQTIPAGSDKNGPRFEKIHTNVKHYKAGLHPRAVEEEVAQLRMIGFG